MATGSSLERTVARAEGLLLADRTVEAVLALLTSTALQAVPASCGAGITLVEPDGGPASAAATDALVAAADAVEYRLAEGPCLTSFLTRRTVRVDDATTDGRWPRWSPAVVELGVRSVLSAPMVAGDAPVGALKLYARDAAAFTEHDETTVNLFAAQSALLAASARTYRDAGRLDHDVRTLLARRDTLQRATGLLTGRDGLTEPAATALLAAQAERERTGVHQVASRLLAAHGRPGAEAS